MHPNIHLKLNDDDFECRWSINHQSTQNRQCPLWQSVDITIQKTQPSKSRLTSNGITSGCRPTGAAGGLQIESLGLSDDAQDFMHTLLLAASTATVGRSSAAKLILPCLSGYVVRSDIIPLRMADCPQVVSVSSFARPQQRFTGETLAGAVLPQLSGIFQAAAGGIIVDVDGSKHDSAEGLDILEAEVRNRLSFPWLQTQQMPQRTVAFVGNYLRYPGHGSTGANHYAFAKALDINLIVLDSPECWLKDPKHADLRGAFLPCDLTRDEGLRDRILEALSHYKGKVDGIVTFHESLQVGVARAAEVLSLPTLPPAALGIAADKYMTSVAAGHLSYLATSAKGAFEIARKHDMRFPLILKPCRGWGSEGVYKVDNNLEYTTAVEALVGYATQHGPRFVIEEYCDGPEVDVNMVISNGELLFVEICDDIPKKGDGVIAGDVSSFIELGQVYPSKLPSSECNLLVQHFHRFLLELGLHSGVFHIEARVKDSEMAYVPQGEILELEYCRDRSRMAKPSARLIEINARPPGISISNAIERMYGIDYVGLGLLFALQDRERIKALSCPFVTGPEYWCQTVLIAVDKVGIFDSEDVCDELLQRRPDLAQYVSRSVCYWRRGETVPDTTGWIAHFIVFSRVGRLHLLEISQEIRQAVRYSIIPKAEVVDGF